MLFWVVLLFILTVVQIIGFKRPSFVFRTQNQKYNANYRADENKENIQRSTDNKRNTSPPQPNFVKKLKNLHLKNLVVSQAEYESLVSNFHAHGSSMDAHSFSSTTLYLGKLYSKLAARSESVRIGCILDYLKKNSGRLTEQDITSIIIGMAHLDIPWDKVKRNEIFMQQVIRISEDLNIGSVGDIFWGLASMGTKWSDLPNPLKSNLKNSLTKHGGNLAAHPLTSVLWSLAKMGARWIELPVPCKNSLLSRIQSTEDFNPHQSSKLLWAVGSIGFGYNEFPPNMMESLISNVGKVSKSKLSPVSASQMLIGVAKSGVGWDHLSESLRGKLWQQFLLICESSNENSISSAFWAMGTLGASISNQPNAFPLQKVILDNAAAAIDNLSSWSLCNVIWGLAKMKFRWQDLPKQFTDSTILNIVRLEGQMNSFDVGTLMWSIGELDFSLDTAPRFFVESLMVTAEQPLLDMKPIELSKFIWGLSGSGLSWNMLSEGIRWNINIALRKLSETLSPQDVANCAYGLSILTFDIRNPSDVGFRGSQEVLLAAMCRTRRKASLAMMESATATQRDQILSPKYPFYDPFTSDSDNNKESSNNMDIQELEQLRIFSHFLNVMQLVINPSTIPTELLDACSLGGQHSSKSTTSRLHERVVEGLTNAFDADPTRHDINVHLEVSSFGGIFPIDAAVSRDGEIMAFLEVDGPQHYRSDGKLRRKDQLKESMYLKKHPLCSFHRIRWDEENSLGFSVVGEELASLFIDPRPRRAKFN